MRSRLGLGVAVLAAAFVVFGAPLASAGVVPAQEKVVLRLKGEPGQVSRSRSTAKIAFEVAGQRVNLEQEVVSAGTVESVGADGTIVVASRTESARSSINGEALPADEEDDSVTRTTMRADGMILSVTTEGAEADDPNTALFTRLSVSTNIVFSDDPVGPGDSWTVNYPANDTLKTRAARGTFTLEAFEELDGVRVARIKMVYAETSGSPALSATSTQWVDLASGEAVKTTSQVTGAELDLGGQLVPITADAESVRISGGFVASATNKAPSEEVKEGAIDAKVKGFEKLDGLFPIYRREQGGRTTLYMEISEAQLGQLVMLQTTASSGIGDGRITAGDPINDLLFFFAKTPNNRIVMKVPNTRFRARSGEIRRAVERSFPEAIVESFTVEAFQEDRKSYLIDISNFFRGDISRVGEILQGGGNPLLGGGSSYSIDRENTFIRTLRNFPKNAYVEVTYNFTGRGGGGGGLAALLGLGGGNTTADDRSIVLTLNYNLFMLPVGNGYQPRLFDPRVGYFTTDYQDFTASIATEQKRQYINRWHLVKKDPSAALSEPVEPIVFWIDNAVPAAQRDAVRRGIEAWNVAFEAAGFKNAVVAKQMPDDAEFDHADMRYNVVRWVTSPEAAYAIALFRTNPMTGQILNTSVSIDANLLRFFASEYEVSVRPEAWQERLENRLKAARGVDHSQCRPGHCTAAAEAASNVAVGKLALNMAQGMPGISREDYVNQFVAWVVAHEVGHTLGLRHNFVASTLLDLEQLGDRATVEKETTSASVMDYVAFNPSALRPGGAKFFGDGVGRYDIMAIRYGYTPFVGKSTDEERFELMQIAQNGNQPGMMWLGDEWADSVDPYVTRFDLGADPMAYWMEMGRLSRQLLFSLDQYSPKQGQSFWHFTRDFNLLLGQYARSADELTRFVGGMRRNPNFKGDPGEQRPTVNIAGPRQREALKQVAEMVFSERAFAFPSHYYEMMTGNPRADLLQSLLAGSNDYPMFDRFAGIQASVLSSLMNPGTLRRVQNQEFEARNAAEALGLNELFTTVSGQIWSELGANRPVTALRRQLQRAHVDALIGMVLEKQPVPAEARQMAWAQLNALRSNLGERAARVPHVSTRVHWQETLARVERALNAQATLGAPPRATGGGSLLDLLGG